MKRIIFTITTLLLPATLLLAQQQKDIFSTTMGEFSIQVLSEGQQNGRADVLIGATPEMLEQYAPDGIIPSAVNAFLIYRFGQLTLVDAGFGTKLFEHLQSLGIPAETIGVVLLTHLHGDHIGGLLRNGKIAFPNATVYLSTQEYNYWTNDEAMNRLPENRRGGFENARKILAAYRHKLQLFEPAALNAAIPTEVIPGVFGIAAFGHTPGHTLYSLESNENRFLIWADLTHAMALQMPHPEIAVTYDVDPVQAVASRKTILDYVAKNAIPVAGSHIAFPAVGWVFATEKGGYVFQNAVTPEAAQQSIKEQLKKYPESRFAPRQ
jgi:glyoxylase-like metal-dependent hydrolase (beta-lactamase superfamily II)